MGSIYNNFLYTCEIQYKKYKWIYFLSAIIIVVGIIVGICLSLRGGSSVSILSFSNKNFLSYLKGSVNLLQIFLANMKNILLATIIVCASSLSIYSVWIGLVYIGYQASLLMFTIGSLVYEFGATGIINSLLLVFPFNLAILVLLSLLMCVGYGFFRTNKKENKMLFALDYDKYIYTKFGLILVMQIVICIVLSFIVPLILKNCIIVAY